MKNKYLISSILSLFIVCLLAGCNSKEDAILDQSAKERTDYKSKELFDFITSSEEGWLLTYETIPGPVFEVLMKLTPDHKVQMRADYVSGMSESTWKITPEESIVLSFDTYGMLHHLADPKEYVSSDYKEGKGYMGEFEFIYDKGSTDEIHLIGRKHGGEFVLKRATADMWNDFEELAPLLKSQEILFGNGFLNVTAPDFRIFVDESGKSVGTFLVNTSAETLDFYCEDTGGKVLRKNGIKVDILPNGFKLKEPIQALNTTLDSFTYQDEEGIIIGVDNSKLVVKRDILPSDYPGAISELLSKVGSKQLRPIGYSTPVIDKLNNLLQDLQGFNAMFMDLGGLLGMPVFGLILDDPELRIHLFAYNKGTLFPDPDGDIMKLKFITGLSTNDNYKPELQEILNSKSYAAIAEFLETPGGLKIIPHSTYGFYAINTANPAEWWLLYPANI